jgi:uncharacterized membrane protein YfhO
MDVRQTFIIGVAVVLFTVFYLEKELTREQIYWLFSGLGVLLGIAAVYISYTKLPVTDGAEYAAELKKFQYYITFAVVSVLMAIFYYPGREEGLLASEGPQVAKGKKKKGKKPKKKQ